MLFTPFETALVETFHILSDHFVFSVRAFLLFAVISIILTIVEVGANEGSNVGIVLFELGTIVLGQIS